MEEHHRNPPKHRHEGTSPLPLGMDWSLPPSYWNGRDTVWPNDYRTGWSYCITIPTWVVVPKARETGGVVFYKVQVGLQSPQGVTTTRTILRNFNDFLSLVGDLRKAFPQKNFPPTPPKQSTRNWAITETRRRTLEDWMTRLLYDIDRSRSIAVASFFELARSSFEDENQQIVERNVSKTMSLDKDMTRALEKLPKYGVSNMEEGLYMGPTNLAQVEGCSGSTIHAQKLNKATNVGVKNGEEVSSDMSLVLPSDQQQEMNKEFIGMQRKLRTAKSDMEDLVLRLKQEIAAKNYLTTKVKDLEDELETTKQRSKENLQQAILVERERVTKMQWDMDELQRKSLEMEFKLKSQQDDKTETETETGSPNVSVIQEKDELRQELDATKNKLNQVLKKHQELEASSKADIKVLVQEVKSLRSSRDNMKQQLDQSLETKSKAEKLLQQEKQKSEKEKVDRLKLIHEYKVLHHQLRECNMNILDETEEDTFFYDSSLTQAVSELLQISDDKIEALLAKFHQTDMLSQDDDNHEVSDVNKADHELKNMLSKMVVDYVKLRKKVSCVVRYAIKLKLSTLTGKDIVEIHAEK